MQTQAPASRSPSRSRAHGPSDPDTALRPWPGLEPEALEDAARSLRALRPGSRAAERLMERAAYLRAALCDHRGGGQATGALLFG